MAYKHRVVEALAQLMEQYGGKGPLAPLWMILKHEVPSLLKQLDDNEEAIAEIESKMREVLGIEEKKEPEPAEVVELAIEAAPQEVEAKAIREKTYRPKKRKKMEEVDKLVVDPAEVVIEPAEE